VLFFIDSGTRWAIPHYVTGFSRLLGLSIHTSWAMWE